MCVSHKVVVSVECSNPLLISSKNSFSIWVTVYPKYGWLVNMPFSLSIRKPRVTSASFRHTLYSDYYTIPVPLNGLVYTDTGFYFEYIYSLWIIFVTFIYNFWRYQYGC